MWIWDLSSPRQPGSPESLRCLGAGTIFFLNKLQTYPFCLCLLPSMSLKTSETRNVSECKVRKGSGNT